MELRGSRSQPGPLTARSAQSAGVLVDGAVREAADRVMAEDDDELAARVGGLELALEPAELRIVEVAVGVQEIALGDGVDRDEPQAGLRAERVVRGLALGRRELVAVDVARSRARRPACRSRAAPCTSGGRRSRARGRAARRSTAPGS